MNPIMSVSYSVLLLCIAFNVKGEMKQYVNEILDLQSLQTINLTCSLGKFMHVVRINYGFCNESQFAEFCRPEKLAAKTSYLASHCVGKQECLAITNVNMFVPTTPTTMTVYYECIEDNRFSLCDRSITDAVYTEPIQLHSNSYPVSRAVGQRCRCNVNGNNMKATVYDIDINDKIGSFSIAGDGRTANLSRLIGLYNNDLFKRVSALNISYYDGGENDQNVWINVAGTGQMTVSCDQEAIDVTSTSGPPTTTSTTSTLTSTLALTLPVTSRPTTATTGTSAPTTAVPVTSRAPPTSKGTAVTTTILAPAPESSTPAATTTSSLFTFSPVNIAIICGIILFFIVMIPIVVVITIKCVKRPKKPNASSPPVVPPRQPEYYGTRHSYLELTNANNTYNKLYGTEPQNPSEYTQLHVYETLPETGPQSTGGPVL